MTQTKTISQVIMGQATIGLELLEEVPDLDIILVPISGRVTCLKVAADLTKSKQINEQLIVQQF